MKKLNKKGFTLVELLAVIVILGVIMLIAIPSVGTIIKNSRENSFISSGKMYISTAQNLIAGEISSTENYCISVSTLNGGKKDKSPIDSKKTITGYVLAKYDTTNKRYDYTAYISADDASHSASGITAESDRKVIDSSAKNYSTECGTSDKMTVSETVDGKTVQTVYNVMK